MTRPLSLPLVLSLWLVACGGSPAAGDDAGMHARDGGGGADTGPAASGHVTGGVIYHSVNRLAAMTSGDPEYTMIDVDIHSQAALAASATATPLATAPLQTTGCGTSGMCPFDVGGVTLASASGGLVVGLRDGHSPALWVPTWTGTASAADVTSAGDSFADARAFIVSQHGFDDVLAPIAGVAPTDLLARGVVFGLVYDASGMPITGATVAVVGRSDVTIVYPNGNFSGTATSTTMQGSFMAVPAAAGTSVAELTFTVTPPSGSTLTWIQDQPALLAPGVLSFSLLYAH
jgi:hypothetical protein